MNLDDFKAWRDYVEADIEYFVSTLRPETKQKLDYSIDSLDVIMVWLLQRYKTPAATTEEPDQRLYNGVVFYVGETYRKNLRGYWNVHFAEYEPNYEYGEQAVIEGFYEDDAICPAFRVLDALDNGDEKYLSVDLEGLTRSYRL